jgi:hyperosmotically inducible protein
MKTMHFFALMAAFGLAGCAEQKTDAQAQREANDESREHEADDTGRNARDREGNTLTPFDQSEKESDVAITRQIRQAIRDDEAMSQKALNAKVITRDGVVTLRGPVDSQAEKVAIEQKAEAVAGVAKVQNELETVVK